MLTFRAHTKYDCKYNKTLLVNRNVGNNKKVLFN